MKSYSAKSSGDDSYIVAGGGLAGLTAANALADALGNQSHKVTVLEQSERLGGRAITQNQAGYLMNLGPHALYSGGVARRTFEAWGIPLSGSRPDLRGNAYLVYRGEKHPFFAGVPGLLRHPLFSFREKLELMRILRLATTPQHPAQSSMEAWILRHARSELVAAFMRAMTRLTTYATDLKHLGAAQTLAQIRSALTSGVLYLDGGWQTLVNGLADRARSRGIEIRTGVPIETLGESKASGVILAVPPESVERISGCALPKLRPSRMACLQIGLRRLPQGSATFALGIDRPIYLSVHSAYAKLAPAGSAVVHAGKYLSGSRTSEPGDDHADRAELEAVADLAMPGWRADADIIQFLPNMLVTHGMAACEGRPEVDALKLPGVAIAGDWVGNDGMLADASVSSAVRAAHAIQNRAASAAA